MTIEQIIVLALVQGITEFLPISSSGHLILVPKLMHWQDQGLIVDVMVHMGSFLAVLVYFHRDVWQLFLGGLELLRGRMTARAKLALYIVIATIPAVVFGLALKKSGLQESFRTPMLVAVNAILFGIVMLVADLVGRQVKRTEDLSLAQSFIIGIAQAIAIIPGTSRSGITMSAGRFLGMTRVEAARFSFLLGIPAIAGAGILVLGEAISSGARISNDALLTGALTFVVALGAIAFLMRVITKVGLVPFVIYRFVLGAVLFWLIAAGYFS
ncbi:undecaprenyl-diphosphate phosphatase [Thermopetrobacter sp. TC1]|uniref:undecaprenyl-diphosphate phosphatase n=1 Tax=Thermopetrobacter sp. TC1 TaxID=1495045 RepID=UPI00056EC909|nr:undecaprenyl-diphosphate phosphatase [Thermopetrobacter sp. TC1]